MGMQRAVVLVEHTVQKGYWRIFVNACQEAAACL